MKKFFLCFILFTSLILISFPIKAENNNNDNICEKWLSLYIKHMNEIDDCILIHCMTKNLTLMQKYSNQYLDGGCSTKRLQNKILGEKRNFNSDN